MERQSTLPPQLQEILLLLSTGGFTVPQRKALLFLKIFTSVASVIDASLLIHIVLRKYRKDRSDTPTFHRFLLGLSIYDVLYEIWSSIGIMAVPRSLIAGGYGALGTKGTCTAQGFFFTLSLGSFIYNAGLIIYYVLVIRYGITEKTIAKYLEPVFHLLALTVPLAFGISGLCFKMYNPPVFAPPETGCYAYPYPPICALTGAHTCERGRYVLRWIYPYVSTSLLSTGIVMVMSVWLYWTVRTQYRTSSRYASQETEQMKQRTRAVACQAFLFAFTCVYIGFWGCLAFAAIHLQLSLSLLKVITFNFTTAASSQGLFNFVIYTRPRYNRLRMRRPEVGRWGALMIVIFGERTNVDDNRHRTSSVIFNKLLTRRRSTAQPSSYQTVTRERRRSLLLSSSMFGATNIEGTTLDRGRWTTLMSVMFGEDNGGRAARRNSLALLFRRRSTIDTTLRQPDSSDATMTETCSPQPQGTHQCSPISGMDMNASAAQNNNELAMASMWNTDAEEKMSDLPTEMGKSLQHDAVRALHDTNVDELMIFADGPTTSPQVMDCESVTLDLHHDDKDIQDLDVSESDHDDDPPVVEGCVSSPLKE